LADVAAACVRQGAETACFALDVTDRDAMRDSILGCDDDLPLDLVVANAGLSGGTSHCAEDTPQTRAIFATNFDGCLNTVEPAIERMRQRRHGQMALISSLAGFRGVPGAPAYCASKAALRVWGEALRPDLARDGIALSVVCPGFIKTPMTDVNTCPMPFLMSAEKAAAYIRAGLAANRARIAFPWPLALAAVAFAALPAALTEALAARLPRK
jgi:short-subunit dehydrogenase